MNTTFAQRPRLGATLAATVMAAVISIGTAMAAAPASASASHFNTNPYTTGCSSSSFTVSSHSVSGGTAYVKASRQCGTNWLEYRGIRQSTTKAGKDSRTNSWTRTQVDSVSVAVSLQSYAPGTTSYTGWIKIGNTTTTAVCAYGCTWTVKTATPSPSSGRTWGISRSFNAGVSGQCTDGAYRQFKAYSGVYPALNGNAKDWYASARATGWSTALDAQVYSIVVFQPGVQGADRTAGHVGWVDAVSRRTDGLYVHVVEFNYGGAGAVWHTRWVKDVAGMSYILAPHR